MSLPLSVTQQEIAEQRSKGWTDWHPEDFCHRCGGRNVPSWHVESDRFNMAMGAPMDHEWNGIVCPGCFVDLHEQATGMRATWKLVPDPTSTVPVRRLPGGDDMSDEVVQDVCSCYPDPRDHESDCGPAAALAALQAHVADVIARCEGEACEWPVDHSTAVALRHSAAWLREIEEAEQHG